MTVMKPALLGFGSNKSRRQHEAVVYGERNRAMDKRHYYKSTGLQVYKNTYANIIPRYGDGTALLERLLTG
jgi:hypothetical protein